MSDHTRFISIDERRKPWQVNRGYSLEATIGLSGDVIVANPLAAWPVSRSNFALVLWRAYHDKRLTVKRHIYRESDPLPLPFWLRRASLGAVLGSASRP